ncbi:hypothetical protein ACF0H5_015729 [Mactra antiquata]
MEFPTYYQQQPMYQPSQQTMIQPQPLIQPVQQTAGWSIQDKQIALAVLKELKEIKTLFYPLKDLCEIMAKKQQSCSVQFQAQEMKVPVRFMTEAHHGQGRHSKKMPEEPAFRHKKKRGGLLPTENWIYDNQHLKVVNDLTIFNYTGNFALNQQHLIGKALKAFNLLLCICKKFELRPNILGQLFDSFAAYFTTIFPSLVLGILFARGITLKGSVDGVIYFFKPQWYKLLESKVWSDATVQIFFSLMPGSGGLLTLSSYNKFNNNCFNILGYMAAELNQPISEVVQTGPGLVFIVYPNVVTELPISQLWSVLFFIMIVALGIGSQISRMTTVHTTLLDRFPELFRKNQKRRTLLLTGIACVCYMIGLIFTSQGGMYVLQLFDNYASTFSLLVIGVVESIALSWVYGK